jgi:putative aldouronate transport system substrate-binding protein
MKRLSLLLVLFIVLSSTDACSNNAQQPPAAGELAPADTSDGNFNATGMPIVNTPVTLDVTTMRWGAMGDSFKQNTWLQNLEATSNVVINWNAVSNEGWGEARNLLLLSGDLPDVFLGNMTIEDGNVLLNPSLFLDLTDLIDKYMPNYKGAMDTIPALKQITTYPDGGIYSLAKNLPARPMTRNQLIINTDWLNAAGISAPTDIASFEDMLRAFRDQDVNGNGDASDEIPFTFAGDIPLDFYSMFGLTDINASAMYIEDGVPKYIYTSDRYREALKWLNKVYTEGLIDPVGFTQDGTAMGGKYRNEAIATVGCLYAWSFDAETGLWADQYDIYAPIAGPDGNRYAEGDPNGVYSLMRNEAHITSSCEYPEVAARWLDAFYESEASIQNFWGAIGVVINKNDNGTYTLNNAPDGNNDAWYWDQSLRDFGPKYVAPGFSDSIVFDKTVGDGRKLEDSKLADPYIMEQYPLVIYTAEESEALAITGTEIGSYASQMRATFVTEGGVDEGWDAYVAQMEAIGLNEFVEIKVDAYNRFKG